jgi:hypothetical protein
MGKGTTTRNDLMLFYFNATAMPAYGATLYLSLHTADPGAAGVQTTSEASYGSYTRIGIVRTNVGWTVAANQAVNASLVQFPTCTATPQTITHVAIGTTLAAAGQILYYGALSASISVVVGTQPQFGAGSLIFTEA